ncbi:MAG TPA: DUF2721 domain-containing protein [Gemmatimonadaceae bacterium]
MQQETAITAVGHAIQLSVAPVFLLSGIGAILAVITSRLARITDRGRAVQARLRETTGDELALLHAELDMLSRRVKLINISLTLCTVTAIAICGVIATLFITVFLNVQAPALVAILFIAGMATFIAGLLCFLREVLVASAHVGKQFRFRP